MHLGRVVGAVWMYEPSAEAVYEKLICMDDNRIQLSLCGRFSEL